MPQEASAAMEISESLLLNSDNLRSEECEVLEQIPHWKDQITVRGLVVSAFLGTIFCIITHKLNLTVGIIPSLNVGAGLLAFFLVRSWAGIASKLGLSVRPFTRQENAAIQTCVVACYGIAFSGGFGSYLLAMSDKTYHRIGPDYPGNRADEVKNPSLGWTTGFLFVVSFLGLCSLIPLRKVMVTDRKLTYPSGTATAMLINSFHTDTAELAGKQVSCLGKYLCISLCWSCFKWFFSGIGDSCGFEKFPTFGLSLFKNTFYFNFSPTYVGCGLICPHIVNCSFLLGAIISWGFLWPLISKHAGNWYPPDLGSNDFRGLYGYKVFIAISLILGDGTYNLIKIMAISVKEMMKSSKQRTLPLCEQVPGEKIIHVDGDGEASRLAMEDERRDEVFLKDSIPSWVAVSGYVGLAVISAVVIPMIFPPLRWYLVLTTHVFAPALAFSNSYGTGLTDCNLSSTYGKIFLLVIASIVGDKGGGVMAGLVACGMMMSTVSSAADLMQDFKTGYLTLSSMRSMWGSQVVGTTMGCIIAPLTFWLFWVAFDVGAPEGPYMAPNGVIFREMAILGVEGFSCLPRHCLALCGGFFATSVGMNLARDLSDRVSWWMPIPMAMAVPFYIGAYVALDMFTGTMIMYMWEWIDRRGATTFSGSVASGLICGDGVWTIPSALLSIIRVNPPFACILVPPALVSWVGLDWMVDMDA